MTIQQTPFEITITAATSHLSNIDPVMRTTIEQIGPCTLRPNPDIFHALVDAIISQQISVKAADAILADSMTYRDARRVDGAAERAWRSPGQCLLAVWEMTNVGFKSR